MSAPTPFTGSATEYDRFMGRYTIPLARALVDVAGLDDPHRLLDVGCGPGGLAQELAERFGGERIAAIDPAPQFVAACAERVPGCDARVGVAEALPWAADEFDAVLSCLVFAFMKDPELAAREMLRVARPGGTLAACMWDLAGHGMGMFQAFWRAMRTATGAVQQAERRPGTADGQLADYFAGAGAEVRSSGALVVSVEYPRFDDFWQPFCGNSGPATDALKKLSERDRESVREAAREQLGAGPFSIEGRAWFAVATAP